LLQNIYLKACELLGAIPSECLAIEDSPNGIRSTFSAELKPVMIPDLIQAYRRSIRNGTF
jgi:beta-phosphoglucomutase-like phosphatase (HAD superfamily)